MVFRAALCALAATAGASSSPLSGAALFADVENYASFDTHRTASAEEVASSRWIEGELAAAGLTTSTLDFTLDSVFDYDDADADACVMRLRVPGGRSGAGGAGDAEVCHNHRIMMLPCFPLWLPNDSAVHDIPIVLSLLGSGSDRCRGAAVVVWCSNSGTQQYGSDDLPTACGAAIDGALGAGAAAVLVVNDNSFVNSSAPIALNAPYSPAATAVPVVVLSAWAWGPLAAAAASDTEEEGRQPPPPPQQQEDQKVGAAGPSSASSSSSSSSSSCAPSLSSLRVRGAMRRGAASANVEAVTPLLGACGGDAAVQNIVVTTPISGWFRCGGERGPGVALFLGLARWAMALPDATAASLPCTRVHFFGSTGHELMNYGAHLTMKSLPELGLTPATVASWLHLGASITTFDTFADGGAGAGSGTQRGSVQFSSAALGGAVSTPLLAAGFFPGPTSNYTPGELRDVVDAGFTAWGFFGGFERFHTAYDDASSTSAELLGPVGAAVGEAMLNAFRLGQQ